MRNCSLKARQKLASLNLGLIFLFLRHCGSSFSLFEPVLPACRLLPDQPATLLQCSPDINVCNINGNDFEGGLRIKTFCQYSFADDVGFSRTPCDFLPTRWHQCLHPPCKDGFFGCTTDQLLQVCTHRNSGFDLQLNAVFGDRIKRWLGRTTRRTVNDLRINTGLDRLQHISPRQVDGSSFAKRKRNRLCFFCRNQRTGHLLNISTRQIVGFQGLLVRSRSLSPA